MLWGIWNIPSVWLLPDPLSPGVVAPDRVLSMDQEELFDHLNCVLTNDLCWTELFEIELFDHLTVCKQMTDV